MGNFFDLAFSMVNLPVTLLFGLVLLYWSLTMLTGLDLSVFDGDIDIDMDVDADIDSDLDIQDVSNSEIKDKVIIRRGKLNFFQLFLKYFNFIGLPFMFTFSFFVLLWWTLTLSATTITNTESVSFGYIFFFGNILPALILTKIMTTPFKSFFKKINTKGEKKLELLGRQGILKATISGSKMTLLDIKVKYDLIRVMVVSKDGVEIQANSNVQIINKEKDKSIYIIEKLNY